MKILLIMLILIINTYAEKICTENNGMVFKNGELFSISECDEYGKRNGRLVAFYSKDTVSLITTLNNGNEHGIRFRFNERKNKTIFNGNILYATSFNNGKKNGLECWFLPDYPSTSFYIHGKNVKETENKCFSLHGIILGMPYEAYGRYVHYVDSDETYILIKKLEEDNILGLITPTDIIIYRKVNNYNQKIISKIYANYSRKEDLVKLMEKELENIEFKKISEYQFLYNTNRISLYIHHNSITVELKD